MATTYRTAADDLITALYGATEGNRTIVEWVAEIAAKRGVLRAQIASLEYIFSGEYAKIL